MRMALQEVCSRITSYSLPILENITFYKSMKTPKYVTLKADRQNIFALFYVENQSGLDYSMVIRCMVYDSLRYAKMAKNIREQHRIN